MPVTRRDGKREREREVGGRREKDVRQPTSSGPQPVATGPQDRSRALLSADNLITTLLEGGREPFVWPSIRQ